MAIKYLSGAAFYAFYQYFTLCSPHKCARHDTHWREIKLGKYCAAMSDMIRICLNFELSEVRLICHQFEESGGGKFEYFESWSENNSRSSVAVTKCAQWVLGMEV